MALGGVHRLIGVTLCRARDRGRADEPLVWGCHSRTYIHPGIFTLLMFAFLIVAIGFWERSATEMAVTNRKVLVKVAVRDPPIWGRRRDVGAGIWRETTRL